MTTHIKTRYSSLKNSASHATSLLIGRSYLTKRERMGAQFSNYLMSATVSVQRQR